jgi:hypothetical protein
MALIFVTVFHLNYTSLVVYFLLVVFTTLALARDGQVLIRLNVTRLHIQIGLTLISGGLLYSHLSNIELNGIWLAVFVVVMILLPGVSALELIQPNPKCSRWEDLGLAYGLGFSYDCIAGILVLGVSASARGTWLLSSTLAFSLLSALVGVLQRKHSNHTRQPRTISIGYDDLLLVGILGALTLFYIGLYPQLSTHVNDIYRGYLHAKLVSSGLSAGATTADGPLLYVFQSLPFSVASPSAATFQTTYILLNLFIVISFYAMAKVVLRGKPHQTPVIATAFWSLFSGFGWIEYLVLTINAHSGTLLSAIEMADAVSYGDLTWRRNFYFLSMEASLAIAFLIIYLALRTDTGAKRIALLVPLAILIPYLHPYTIYFLVLFLSILAIVLLEQQRNDLRQVGFSVLLAALPGFAASYILGMRGLESFPSSYEFLVCVGVAILLVCSPSLGHRVHIRLPAVRHIVKRDHAVLSIATVLMVVYLGFLLSWYAGVVPFSLQSLDIFGYVPWELYPVRLGIVGALGILGFFLTFKRSSGITRELVSLFILTVLMIAALRATSEFQLLAANQIQLSAPGSVLNNITQILLNIREERFLDILMIPLSLIAAVAVTSLVSSQSKHTLSRQVVILALVSMLVVSGVSSTVINVKYDQSIANNPQLNSFEVDALQTVQSQALRQGTSVITSPTTDPSLLVSSESTIIVTESPAIWASTSPEFPLLVLRNTQSTPTYIFLNNGSDTAATSENSTYLDQLTSLAGTTVQNQGAKVKLVQNMSSPSSSSNTALVVPYDASTESVVQPVSSKGGGLVLGLYFTPNSSSYDYSRSTPTYSNVQMNGTAVFNGTKSYISIPDTSKYPSLQVEFTFQPLSVSGNQVVVSKLDYGGNPQESWEVARYGQTLGFKVSPDGSTEFFVQTGNILTLGTTYKVNCIYDHGALTISVDNHVVASKPYDMGIFNGTSDILVGGELSSGHPTAFAQMLLDNVTVSNSVQTRDSALYDAYDLLSSAELNFTTVLAQDSRLSGYNTLVLPYDDVNDNATLESALAQTAGARTFVVMNGNGFGPILGDFGMLSSQSIVAGKVGSPEATTALEQPVNVSVIIPNDRVDVVAWYSSGKLTAPFIMSRSYGDYTMVYVDTLPLVQKEEIVGSGAAQLAGTALEPFIAPSDPASVSPWFTSPSIIFSSMNSTGSIVMKSNSIIIAGLNETNGLVLESGGTKITVGPTSSLVATGYDKVEISAARASIGGGYGFYSFVTLSNSSLVFSGTNLVNVNAGESHLSGQQVSVIIPKTVILLVREPMVSIDGLTDFNGFYSLHPPSLYSDGRPIQLKGSISFQMYSGDTSSVALPVSFGAGAVATYKTPVMSFNEWSAFLASAPYVAAIACVTILGWLFFKMRSRKEQTRADSPTGYHKTDTVSENI